MDMHPVIMALLVTVIVVLGIIAIKFTVSFKIDWVARQKRKDEKMRLKLKNICPHTSVESVDKNSGKIVIKNQFFKPAMTFFHTCQWCGLQTQNTEYIAESMVKWQSDPNGLIKQMEEYGKLVEKYLR